MRVTVVAALSDYDESRIPTSGRQSAPYDFHPEERDRTLASFERSSQWPNQDSNRARQTAEANAPEKRSCQRIRRARSRQNHFRRLAVSRVRRRVRESSALCCKEMGYAQDYFNGHSCHGMEKASGPKDSGGTTCPQRPIDSDPGDRAVFRQEAIRRPGWHALPCRTVSPSYVVGEPLSGGSLRQAREGGGSS